MAAADFDLAGRNESQLLLMPLDADILRKILQDLRAFSNGRMSLSELIARLEIRGRELDGAGQAVSELWRHWYVLEDVLAEALAREPKGAQLTSDEAELVERAIVGLRHWGTAQVASPMD
jgi:hypothetical protein